MSEPTMADIATHLGISRQLVSIVLRDMPGASDVTRERVRQAAKDLGYSPNMGARSLRQTRSRHIGIAFTPTNATEPDIVEAIYPAATENGYHLVLSAQTRTRSAEQAIEELLTYRCAAIIHISPLQSGEELCALAQRVKVPLVVVGAGELNRTYDVVRSAGDEGVALTVRHLVDLGHRRIAYVHGKQMPPAALRLTGYEAAMLAAGLEPDVVVVPGDDFTEEAGSSAARALLQRKTLPTAVVTGNDQEAVGVMQVLTRAGLSVPDDVSITGFDDSRFAQLSSIDLTTARQDPVEMGEAAVALAVRRIGRPTAHPSITVIDPSLVVRSSTGSARS